MSLTEQQRADLEEVMDAAGSWADELATYIADGSEECGDEESAESQRKSAEVIREAVERLALITTDPRQCEWFAACDRPAVTLTPHPLIGKVPTCQRCAEKLERLGK